MVAKRRVRFTLMLTDDEERDLQRYRFDKCFGTKAGAARSLIKKGLASLEAKDPAGTAIPPGHGSNNPVEGKADEQPGI